MTTEKRKEQMRSAHQRRMERLRNDPEAMARYRRQCNAAHSLRYHMYYKNDPEWLAKRRAYRNAWYARLKEERPEKYAEILERHKLRARELRRERGAKSRPRSLLDILFGKESSNGHDNRKTAKNGNNKDNGHTR